MTEKKEKILNAALKLFADDGYKATSTSRVAKAAGVSEGLIFRHFKNKEGLLEAILQQGEEKAKLLFSDIVMESNPKLVIKKLLGLPKKVSLNRVEAGFWKLQYKIKWEIEKSGEHKIEALERAIEHAFGKLGYEDPEMEAQRLLMEIDGLAMKFFLHADYDLDRMTAFLYGKYDV